MERQDKRFCGLLLRTACLTGLFSCAAVFGATAALPTQAAPVADTAAAPAAYIQQAAPTLEPSTPAARYALTDAERLTVERTVMSEAGNASPELQRAVAQCILNTAEVTGQRPDEVATAPNQYAALWEGEVSPSVKAAVSAVFDDGAEEIDAPVQYFYAPRWMPSGTSEWHETLTFVAEIDGVRFFTAEPNE